MKKKNSEILTEIKNHTANGDYGKANGLAGKFSDRDIRKQVKEAIKFEKKHPVAQAIQIPYGILGNPHRRNIERNMKNHIEMGYTLSNREDARSGCLTPTYGNTNLTFTRKPMSGFDDIIATDD